MKIGTLLKAGSLALDIFNHQSTRQLTGLVSNGIRRRGLMPQGNLMTQGGNPFSKAGAQPVQSAALRLPRVEKTAAAPRSKAWQQEQWPGIPVRQALKYVTPDNMKKAMQWHGIIKSFIEKD